MRKFLILAKNNLHKRVQYIQGLILGITKISQMLTVLDTQKMKNQNITNLASSQLKRWMPSADQSTLRICRRMCKNSILQNPIAAQEAVFYCHLLFDSALSTFAILAKMYSILYKNFMVLINQLCPANKSHLL